MDNFRYCTPTRYEFGRGTEAKTGELAKQMGASKIMIVFGKNHAKTSGLLDRVEASLSAAGVNYVELGGVNANPSHELVYQGIAIAREQGVDAMLAVGGGSVIDTAKAIAAGVCYDGDFWDFYCGKARVENALPVGVVLTIPAAGSEGSGNSVITHTGADGVPVKIGIRTDILRPRFAVMNPELTFSLSPRQTAIGVMDMISHILERYFTTTQRVEVTDRLAEGLILALMEEAPRAMANPEDYDARANVEWAATQAHNGLCGCGRVEDWTSHAMEHEISAVHPEVPHGAGLAVVFPAWMSFMAHYKPEKVAQLGRRVFNVSEPDDHIAAIETVAAFRAFISIVLCLPLTFKELGVENPDIETFVQRLHINKGEEIGGYYRLRAEDTRQIYELMLEQTEA